MKLCLLTGEYPPLQGGVGDYTGRLAAALAAQAADVHVLTGVRSAGQPSPAGVQVHSVLEGWGWRMNGAVSSALRAIRPDVLHIQYQAAAYGLHPAVTVLPRLLRRQRPRPLLFVTLHDLLFPYLFPKAGPLRFRSVLAMARACDGVVVTNEEDRTQLLENGGLPPVHLIPIGSNIAVQPPAGYDRAAWRAGLGLEPGDTVLAYFGFLSPAKGGETLVRALGLLQGQPGISCHLLMVGGAVGDSDPTNQAYLGQVWTLIRQMGLEERVHWTGFVEPQQVSAHLLAADMAVLPYRDGANLRHGSLHAALSHGLPVVTTCRPDGGAALNDGGEALLVPPGDAPALAGAVAALAADGPMRSRLSAGAAALARRYTWESIAAAHLDLYGASLPPPA